MLQLFNRDKAVLLLYLAIYHYIKANAEYFIQRAEALAVLILVIAGKSAGGQISCSQVSTVGKCQRSSFSICLREHAGSCILR